MARIAKPKSKVIEKDNKKVTRKKKSVVACVQQTDFTEVVNFKKFIENTPVPEEDKIGRIIKRIRNKVSVKYDEDIHMRMLLELYENGGDIAQFCALAEIPRGTFYRWVNHNESFLEAYDLAKELARDDFDRKSGAGLWDQAKFNTKMWQMLMKSRFGASDKRDVSIPGMSRDKTAFENFQCIIDALASNVVNSEEAQSLSTVVMAGCKIYEATHLKEQVDSLMAKHGEQ